MIEVFKTNVEEPGQAENLIGLIHEHFNAYKANFDLEDHDRILRVKCLTGTVESHSVINLMEKMGFEAEILADELSLNDW